MCEKEVRRRDGNGDEDKSGGTKGAAEQEGLVSSLLGRRRKGCLAVEMCGRGKMKEVTHRAVCVQGAHTKGGGGETSAWEQMQKQGCKVQLQNRSEVDSKISLGR